MPYVPFAMILRQQSYTISRSLTCLPSSPCHTVLLGKRSFIHFDNATFFYRFGISFAQLLHAELQQLGWQEAGEEKDSPHGFSKRTRTQDYTSKGFKQKRSLPFASLKLEKASVPPHFISLGLGCTPACSG